MWMGFWLRASLRNHMCLWREKKEEEKKRQQDVWLIEQQHTVTGQISVNQFHQNKVQTHSTFPITADLKTHTPPPCNVGKLCEHSRTVSVFMSASVSNRGRSKKRRTTKKKRHKPSTKRPEWLKRETKQLKRTRDNYKETNLPQRDAK